MPTLACPRLYAHRGAAIEEPENTLPAFRRALELGADALETDAHLTRDGHVVLSHDATGRRMAGVSHAIRAMRLAEVKRWDAGFGFLDARGGRPFSGRGYEFPTLEELLVEVPGVPLNVDAKQSWPSMVPALVSLVRRHGAQSRVRIASFSTATLEEVRALGYEGETGLARREIASLLVPLPAFARRRPRGNAAQIPTRVGPIRLDTQARIAHFHALGLRVDFWTINDPREARRLVDAGADGIMTDDPGALASLFSELRASTSNAVPPGAPRTPRTPRAMTHGPEH